MTTTVKICGLKTADTIRQIAGLPIDYIGFVFAASKRQVTPEQAGELVRLLRATAVGRSPLPVGVFVNPTEQALQETLAQAPLDAVQLHGQESPEFCLAVKRRFGVRLFKVCSVVGVPDERQIDAELSPFAGAIDALLLDKGSGGTGQTFDWKAIPAYRRWAAMNGVQVMVAGGLHPGNVGELVQDYAPDGVDVSSGVETEGHKDIAKIKTFVERVKQLG